MKELTVVCIIVLLGYVQSQGQCPPGDVQDPNTQNCYTINDGDGPNDLLTFNEARSSCQQAGGDLFMPQTEIQMRFMRQLLISRLPNRYWLGMQEVVHEWRWTNDNSLVTSQGCYDRNRLPDNFISRGVSSTMNPSMCTPLCRERNNNFAAVRYLGSSGNVECLCSTTFDPHPDDLVSDCNKVCSGYENEEGPKQHKCGSENRENYMLVFNAGGSELYNPWDRSQPNNFDGYQACLALVKDQHRFGDEKCHLTEEMGHICQYDSDVNCPGQLYVGVCLQMFKTDKNWFEADKDCRDKGGRLVQIESYSLWEAIAKNSPVANNGGDKWWIGGFLTKWVFINGAMIEHSEWAVDEPDQLGEACAATYRTTNGGDFLWEDYDCTTRQNYICQRSVPATTTTTTTRAPTTTTTQPTTTTTTTTTQPTTTTVATTTTKDNPDPSSSTTTTTTKKTGTPRSSTVTPESTTPQSSTDPGASSSATPEPSATPTPEPDSPTTVDTGEVAKWDGLNLEDDKGNIIAIAIAAAAILAGLIRLIVFCCHRKTGEDTEKLDA